jgi:tRNA (guanine37-N1)-methyltransferase
VPLFTILTLFPEALAAYLSVGIVGQARARGLLDVRLVDFRDWTRDRHRTVDDRPFGGGPGMVLKPEPITEAIEWIEARHGEHRKIALCPAGIQFRQPQAANWMAGCLNDRPLLLICGRYEGFDERLYDLHQIEACSIGDYVLAGGELPALCVLEACARLIPGALGDDRSAREDSFQTERSESAATGLQGCAPGDLGPLDHPHYTRPRVYRSLAVPDVLLGGDHAAIASWREAQAIERTRTRRPDLAR